MKRLILFAIFFSSIGYAMAQDKDKIVGEDKPISTPFCTASVGWTFPDGEMGKRYSSFMNLNANLGWKTKENWVWMTEFGFAFGSDNAKQKNEILSGIMANEENPFVISQDGSDAGVIAYNRNLSLVGKVGKIFSLSKKSPNSGIFIMLGGGFLQHQIVYQATLEKAKQLEDDYAYLYDRQMRGFMLSSFVGYIHMGKTNFTNFYLGLEFNQAWTKMTRKYQVDLKGGDNTIYQDRMWTIKLGWMFPFYGRDADKVYYY